MDEKVELSAETMIKFTPPRCSGCGGETVVALTRAEYKRLVDTVRMEPETRRDEFDVYQAAMPDRDPEFVELVRSGTHRRCLDALTKGGTTDEALA